MTITAKEVELAIMKREAKIRVIQNKWKNGLITDAQYIVEMSDEKLFDLDLNLEDELY